MEKHKKQISNIERDSTELNSLHNLQVRDLRFPEREISELFEKLVEEKKSRTTTPSRDASRSDTKRSIPPTNKRSHPDKSVFTEPTGKKARDSDSRDVSVSQFARHESPQAQFRKF